MKQAVMFFGFMALIIGTVGLLLNEFVFHWGTAATLSFAAVDFLGIIALVVGRWGIKSG